MTGLDLTLFRDFFRYVNSRRYMKKRRTGTLENTHVFRKQATQRLAEFGTMGVPTNIYSINFHPNS